MYQTVPLVTVDCTWQTALVQATILLENAGLQVLCSFDLQAAKPANSTCTCPHHGTIQCSCQMVILLVYGEAGQFVTLVAHGNEGQTHFSLVDSAQQPVNALLEAVIRKILVPSVGL